MKRRFTLRVVVVFPLFMLYLFLGVSRAQPSNVISTILLKDSLFWTAYNNCDIDGMMRFIANDVEFYHDKNGMLIGEKSFRDSFKKNLCGDKNFRLRREAIKGSVNVFPMKNGDSVYGAVISGKHLFYVTETGKNERLDGIAQFSNIWLFRNAGWTMVRILSYDHGPAPYINSRKETLISSNNLNGYSGTFNSLKNGIITIKRDSSTLALMVNSKKFVLYHETGNLFFVKERDLTFEFVKNEKKEVTRLIVRENGTIAEEDELIK
jgi:hypothetical protein